MQPYATRQIEGPLAHFAPHYHLVPTDTAKQLDWRAGLYKQARNNPAAQKRLRKMCAEDVLFWINFAAWTYNTRLFPKPTEIPFNTYAFQDDAILEFMAAIHGHYDILIEKSRDMGASWLILAVIQWLWAFVPQKISMLLLSRTEEYVDKKKNDKSLFAKLDFILKFHKKYTPWLIPESSYVRSKNSYVNLDTESAIDGEATTADSARGDRRLVMMMDEFAAVKLEDGFKILKSTQDTADCRCFNSTPQGSTNAFADRALKTPIKKLRLHWSVHPLKRAGLYTSENGRLKKLDAEYQHEADYKFVLDGKLRSSWYDAACVRANSDAHIAQELDIDWAGSGSGLFKESVLETHKRLNCRPPYLAGEIDYDVQTGILNSVPFQPCVDGRLKLWTHLGSSGAPSTADGYVIGADIAAGTGASNSAACVGNRTTNEMVAEFVTPHMSPDEFAAFVCALGRWFRDASDREAHVIWEHNGPGQYFTKRILDLGYRNLYLRENVSSLAKKQGSTPGWWTGKETKGPLLREYARVLNTSEFVNRSVDSVDECLHYQVTDKGQLEHDGTLPTKSGSGWDGNSARENHGDRAIAAALCWWGIKSLQSKAEADKVPEAPASSFMARRLARDKVAKDVSNVGSEWVEFGDLRSQGLAKEIALLRS